MMRFSVIGAGKVGRVLAQRFHASAAFQVQQILNRTLPSAQQACAFVGAGTAVADWAQLTPVDVWMLAVGDDHLAAVCQHLVKQDVLQPGNVVFHCSGSKASTELQAATAAGAVVASVHPIRSFANPALVAADFSGTICSVEGDALALDILSPALQRAGATLVQISAANKLLYHAGSVFASNYLVTLIEVALQTYAAAGIPSQQALAMAAPLARQSLENALTMGCATALTGPIARGDLETVSRQQAAVQRWNRDAGELYRSFVPLTRQLASKRHHSEK